MAIGPDVPPSQPSAFPEDLPPRPIPENRTFKERNCPNMRTCWHFSFRSYDLRNCPDKATLFRRIAMIYTLFVRTGMSTLALVSAIRAMNIGSIVVYAILAVIGFWFIAWCLAVIGDAQGERRIMGKSIVS
jgi:hypothetical protein